MALAIEMETATEYASSDTSTVASTQPYEHIRCCLCQAVIVQAWHEQSFICAHHRVHLGICCQCFATGVDLARDHEILAEELEDFLVSDDDDSASSLDDQESDLTDSTFAPDDADIVDDWDNGVDLDWSDFDTDEDDTPSTKRCRFE